jgi:hypothetical protein
MMERPHLPPLNSPSNQRNPAPPEDNDNSGYSHSLILISKRKKYLLYFSVIGLLVLTGYFFFSASNWSNKASQQNTLAKEWETTAIANEALLKKTVASLNASEAQISQLTKRQSSLANEKAKAEDSSELLKLEAIRLEDQRSRLEQSNQILLDIAVKLNQCKNNLSDVVNALSSNQNPSQSASQAYAPCNNAESLIRMVQQ